MFIREKWQSLSATCETKIKHFCKQILMAQDFLEKISFPESFAKICVRQEQVREEIEKI
jgi:hypothetical protein